ncbi:PLDc N-terminal domain-containing protein [Roseibacillus ishigakijimensis]|uniref:PLDc_N domain-containing protein n=1 Tax=Roseibacillus ishigakijimensis TaxID=454146 RepID=A0A934RRS8_9BACT|nr:PLD nuclease N-terminal domain-containing protein [Roseibacillus ishigakijimensis]MBK1833346.1 PLDc_N domain-containing protein [Roseibacillus ishigakijimensis]
MLSFGGQELFIIFILLTALPLFALWVWSLVDCAQNEPSEGNDKLIWILVIALAGWVGSLIYLFVRRPQRKAEIGR